jgi:hypothetical protein
VPQEQLVVKAKGQQRKVDDRKDRKPQRPHSPQKVPKRSSLPLKNSYINPCRAGAANLRLLSVAPTDIDLAGNLCLLSVAPTDIYLAGNLCLLSVAPTDIDLCLLSVAPTDIDLARV